MPIRLRRELSLRIFVFLCVFLPSRLCIVRRLLYLLGRNLSRLIGFDGNLMCRLADFACWGVRVPAPLLRRPLRTATSKRERSQNKTVTYMF
jgi:hypothetical protein